MHPVILDLGVFKIHSYGFAIFLAFLLGSWVAVMRAKRVDIPANSIMDLVLWILISSLLGARITYVIFHFDEFKHRLLDIISPIQSDGTVGIAGLVVLGGVLTALPVVWFYLKKKNLSFLLVIDVMIPSLALGLAIGRLGCFMNGCCFGHPTGLPWGVEFPNNCLAGSVYPHQKIHPTQLYETIYATVIFVFLLWMSKRQRFTGELMGWFFALYGIFRFINESVRHYDSTILFLLFGIKFTFSMSISIILVLSGIWFIVYGYRNGRAPKWLETKTAKSRKHK